MCTNRGAVTRICISLISFVPCQFCTILCTASIFLSTFTWKRQIPLRETTEINKQSWDVWKYSLPHLSVALSNIIYYLLNLYAAHLPYKVTLGYNSSLCKALPFLTVTRRAPVLECGGWVEGLQVGKRKRKIWWKEGCPYTINEPNGCDSTVWLKNARFRIDDKDWW